MVSRRSVLSLVLAAAAATPAHSAGAQRALKALHKRIGGRLGVHILDSQSGRRIAYDDDSRYAMASTFKLPLAAALLWQVDHGAFPISRTLAISTADLKPTSPAVEARLAAGATGMTISELCAAVVVHSDNAAANVLLAGIGGPHAFTQFMRSIGDKVTRLDRNELDLNENQPGDERDTTTPRAMVDSLLRIFTQDVLSLTSRAMLIDWMSASRTGLDRVRAGIPKSWPAGDKTGTGPNGAVNDLCLVYPPDRRPIFVAVYMSESTLDVKTLVAAHAEIGTLIAKEKWP
ncbi:MAG: Beta-lactamase [Steroidobacteraceae bacterium]|jgi:beta-lactamase class A|nr:Beta-lactamase [Steroidobacteraceae bacterium]